MGDNLRFNIKQLNKSKPAHMHETDKKLVKTSQIDFWLMTSSVYI